MHADRDVDIKPNRHAAALRDLLACRHLAVGDPLQEFMEFATGALGHVQVLEVGKRRMTPGLRPFRPRLSGKARAQLFKT